MKNVLRTVIITVLVFSMSSSALFASSKTDNDVWGSWESTAIIDGEELILRIQLHNDQDISLKLREFMEHLGYDVNWIGESRSIELVNAENTISIKVGDNKCVKNGIEIALDKPVFIEDDYSYFYQSFLTAVLGFEIVSVDMQSGSKRIDVVYISTIE